jgi:hypothetical protein
MVMVYLVGMDGWGRRLKRGGICETGLFPDIWEPGKSGTGGVVRKARSGITIIP